ncbi:MAG: hypothetical protein QM736_24975 [Vicinamibacterales bacterium]
MYRRQATAQKCAPCDAALYLLLFPQLDRGTDRPLQGHCRSARTRVTSHSTISRPASAASSSASARRCSSRTPSRSPADRMFTLPASQSDRRTLAWLGVVCYTLQIYFDFSGYSDMAIGLGRMFGFRFPENFH